MPEPPPRDVPVGAREIAELLHVKPQTVHAWSTRGVLPAADLTVHGRPAWWRSTILAWAHRTDRLPERREEQRPFAGPERRRHGLDLAAEDNNDDPYG